MDERSPIGLTILLWVSTPFIDNYLSHQELVQSQERLLTEAEPTADSTTSPSIYSALPTTSHPWQCSNPIQPRYARCWLASTNATERAIGHELAHVARRHLHLASEAGLDATQRDRLIGRPDEANSIAGILYKQANPDQHLERQFRSGIQHLAPWRDHLSYPSNHPLTLLAQALNMQLTAQQADQTLKQLYANLDCRMQQLSNNHFNLKTCSSSHLTSFSFARIVKAIPLA